jgi:hypothetical protein
VVVNWGDLAQSGAWTIDGLDSLLAATCHLDVGEGQAQTRSIESPVRRGVVPSGEAHSGDESTHHSWPQHILAAWNKHCERGSRATVMTWTRTRWRFCGQGGPPRASAARHQSSRYLLHYSHSTSLSHLCPYLAQAKNAFRFVCSCVESEGTAPSAVVF